MTLDARRRRMTLGRARFTGDAPPPDALHLAVVRSDLPRAAIDHIDLPAAGTVPGMVAAFTARDLEPVPRIPIRVGPLPRLERRLQPVLALDEVRYVGEPLAVVVATTPSAAWDAASQVEVGLSPLGPDPNRDGARPPDEVLVEVEARFGSTAEAFDRAHLVVESEFHTSRRTGLPIEPRQLIAQWRQGELHLWGATKFIDFTRRTLAACLGIEADSVVCHRVDVGGMFGVRGEVYPEDILVPWVSRLTGRPVRWQEGRREHLVSINHAGEQHHVARIAVDGSGRLLALEDRVVLDMGAYARPIGSRLPHIIVETLPGPYRWAAVALRCEGVVTHRTPVGTIRGPAAFETAFVRERLVDMAAARLGMEPVEMRRINLIRPESMPHRLAFDGPGHAITYDTGDYPATLRRFEALVDFESLRRHRDRRRAAGEAVGLGWALTVIHSGLGQEESVVLELDTSGTFVLRTSAAEVGQGLDHTLALLVHRRLEVAADGVRVESGEAVEGVEGNGTFSSRSTIFAGGATLDAADRLRALAAERAAPLLGIPAAGVVLGPEGASGPDQALTWKELAPLTAVGQFRMEAPTYGLALHLAQVGVDLETGAVTAERMWVGYDCGRAVDPVGVVDQLTGAAVAGIGGALQERIVFDGEMPVSATLADYVLPRAGDVPGVTSFVFEVAPSPHNPLGAKGAGEAGTIGAGAAVANAVADAIGRAGDSLRSLPVTAASVFAALQPATAREAAG